jgi:hypothetical protein
MVHPLADVVPDTNWLIKYLGIQRAYDKDVQSALQRAAFDAAKIANKLKDGEKISERTRRYQANLVRYQIRDIIKDLFSDLVPTLRAGQRDAAEAAARLDLAQSAQVLKALYPNEDMRKHAEASMVQTARHSIEAMVNRVTGYSPSYPLSRRVYRSGAIASGRLDRKIDSALGRGVSAQELAKAVKKDILPNTPGGVSYAAMRLARTEIGNAFHTQVINSVQDHEWVTDVRWNLSGQHKPDPGDLCEQYAAQGTFNKNEVPNRPHPNCMCYVTPVTDNFQSFADRLKAGDFHAYYQRRYGGVA